MKKKRNLNINILGFCPANGAYKKMAAVYNACEAAGVTLPEEVADYFGDEKPDDDGVAINLRDHESVRDYQRKPKDAEDLVGLEIDVDQLPAGVRLVKVFIAY